MSGTSVRTAVVSVMAASAWLVVACDDNPVNEGREDSVALSINPSFVVVDAADTSAVNANTLNQYGDPTRAEVAFAACDAKISIAPDTTRVTVEAPDRVLVLGGTLGTSCVVLTGAGQSDTSTVEVVPFSLSVTSAPDTLRGGQSGQVVIAPLDKAGVEASPFAATDVTYSSNDTTIVKLTDNAGAVLSSQAGTGEITAVYAAGGTTRSVTTEIAVVANVPASSQFEADSFTVHATGDSAQLEVQVLDAEGNQNTNQSEITGVTPLSSNSGVATVRGDLIQGSVNVFVNVFGQGSGSADITGTVQTTQGDFPFGPSNITIVNPTISGVAPSSGPIGTQITISGSEFELTGLTTEVTVGGETADLFITSSSPTQIVLNAPAAGQSANDVVVTLGGVASAAQTFTQTNSNTDPGETNDDIASATAISLPLDGFFTISDTDLDDYYEMTFTAATTVQVDLDWNTDEDLDILFVDTAGDFLDCFDGATGAQPEAASCTFTAGTFYLWINNFSHGLPLTTYHVTAQ